MNILGGLSPLIKYKLNKPNDSLFINLFHIPLKLSSFKQTSITLLLKICFIYVFNFIIFPKDNILDFNFYNFNLLFLRYISLLMLKYQIINMVTFLISIQSSIKFISTIDYY